MASTEDRSNHGVNLKLAVPKGLERARSERESEKEGRKEGSAASVYNSRGENTPLAWEPERFVLTESLSTRIRLGKQKGLEPIQCWGQRNGAEIGASSDPRAHTHTHAHTSYRLGSGLLYQSPLDRRTCYLCNSFLKSTSGLNIASVFNHIYLLIYLLMCVCAKPRTNKTHSATL